MSEPLGKFFSTRTHYFRKKMSVQNKDLKFLSLVFWKINLRKLILFFQIIFSRSNISATIHPINIVPRSFWTSFVSSFQWLHLIRDVK